MRRHPSTSAPRIHARHSTEIYCRRDNRVYPTCPYVRAGSPCPCLHDVETADALFEPTSADGDREPTTG